MLIASLMSRKEEANRVVVDYQRSMVADGVAEVVGNAMNLAVVWITNQS